MVNAPWGSKTLKRENGKTGCGHNMIKMVKMLNELGGAKAIKTEDW